MGGKEGEGEGNFAYTTFRMLIIIIIIIILVNFRPVLGFKARFMSLTIDT